MAAAVDARMKGGYPQSSVPWDAMIASFFVSDMVIILNDAFLRKEVQFDKIVTASQKESCVSINLLYNYLIMKLLRQNA